MDDDIWDIRINLDGKDNLERTLSESDVTFLNLLALIETEGYGISDNIYYVKEKGIGIAGMDLLDGHSKVQQMVELYEDKRSVSLTVIKRGSTLPSNINTAAVEEQIPISEIGNPIVYTVDDDGVVLPSQECTQLTEDPECMYLLTQQSNNVENDHENDHENDMQILEVGDGDGGYLFNEQGTEHIVDEEQEDMEEDEQEDMEEDEDSEMEDDENYTPEHINETESDEDEPNHDLNKRKRGALEHESYFAEEPEDLFNASDCSDVDKDEPVTVNKKKEPVRKGPTSRSHCSQQSTTTPDWLPSDDEGPDGDLDPEDDDGFEKLSWALPKGRKSRAKKKQPRVWYDESRLQPEEGLCLRMCFLDVYQFRRAVQTLHIAQLRNFRYHRNCKDRVIVKCAQEKCPFLWLVLR